MVSADPRDVARAHRAVEPLHSHAYFAPEQEEHLTAVGLRPGRMCYFAGRAAPMGAVGPGLVTATFYNFSPAIVARHLPRAWTLASPGQVVEARREAARTSLTRLLGGAEAATAPEVAELAGLLREACGVLTPEGRPIYAGHAELPWPEDPVLSLWHGATLLREHRGDGHVACLLRHGLSGLEALVSHTVTGRGFTEPAAKATRGWSDEEWAAARAGLADRGLLGEDGLTDAGRELRAAVETGTDELAAAPWQHLGAERTARVIELGRQLSGRLVADGAFPPGLFAAA
ncbi:MULTISPECIES: SCO6745 family protein [unclassified Geodermatophilus]|uniref:SCO6745 family protein n=1 Tax=unclassified Geodermatophilus TaxID=2637632 RepID=UPI003EE9E9BE